MEVKRELRPEKALIMSSNRREAKIRKKTSVGNCSSNIVVAATSKGILEVKENGDGRRCFVHLLFVRLWG